MGGGLIQLIATGEQDQFITGDPQITFFKSVYKRHTNFSKEIHGIHEIACVSLETFMDIHG